MDPFIFLIWTSNGSLSEVKDGDGRKEDTPLIGFWDYSLKNLTVQQRTIFTTLVVVAVILALFGNVLTIFTNIRREQRHLFRVCLLSLALSDILFVLSTGSTYISQFVTEYTSIWTLGELMCTFNPFIQTMAILVNSITLVAISLDRYTAVVRLIKGAWEPGGLFCITCAILIWGLGAGVSSPMLTLYQIYNVIVLIPDPQKPGNYLDYFKAQICASDKSNNGYYYGIVFTVIFLPLLLVFLWLNLIIAKEIWIRRQPLDTIDKSKSHAAGSDQSSKNKTTTTVSKSKKEYDSSGSHLSKGAKLSNSNNRKRRQLRMFKAIVVIMTVFFICRLPTWVYLLVKLNGVATSSIYWVLHYSFGILSIMNCVLNPLIYTFLSETLRFTTFMSNSFKKICCSPFEKFAGCCQDNSTTIISDHGGVYLGD